MVVQLEGLELARGRHVRPDAEVDERVAVLDRVARRRRLWPAVFSSISCTLSGSPRLREELDRLLARPHLPLVDAGPAPPARASSLRCASRSSGTNGRGDDEVVEEAVVDGRADAALRAGEERRDRGRQQVRRRVAVELQRLGALVGDDLNASRRR